MKKTVADLKAKGKKLDIRVARLVNSCQGKDAGILFRLNYSIHQHTGIYTVCLLLFFFGGGRGGGSPFFRS